MKNNIINFRSWLQNEKKIMNLQTIDSISEYIQFIAAFAIKFNLSQTSFLEMNLPDDFIDVINKLNKNKIFSIKDNLSKKKYSKALDFYHQYLKFAQLQQLNVLNNPLRTDELVDRTNPPDIEVQIVQQNQEQEFLAFLKDTKGVSESKVKNCISALKNISYFCKATDILKSPLLMITTIGEFNQIVSNILGNSVFRYKDKSVQNQYIVALSNYGDFLTHNKINQQTYAEIEVQPLNGNCEISIKKAEYYINQKKYNERQRLYLKTLDEHFSNGIRISSLIQLNKFKKCAQQIDSKTLLPDNEFIINELAGMAVYCEDSLYMSPNKIVEDKALLERILQFVLDAFNEAKKAIYFDSIFHSFRNELIYTNVYNPTVLKGLLEYFVGDYFCIQKNYVLLTKDVVVEAQDEIKQTIKNSDTPLSKDAVLQLLPYISQSKISEVLKHGGDIIYWQKNVYWHIDRIDVSELEKNLLRDVIWYETRDGFVSAKKLYEIFKVKASKFIENNCIMNHVCLRDILKCYFAHEFGFKYTFVGKIGEEMSGVVATRNFIKGKEAFTISDLSEFVEENDLPGMYNIFIADAIKTYVRLDEDNFILKEKLHLSNDMIKGVESTTRKYLTNGYAPLASIDSFTIFPAIGYRWNVFLLQSIIEGYCDDLKIFSSSRSVTKPIGVIVDKSFGFDNYEKVLIEEIAKQNTITYFADEKAAIEYLFNNGYVAQRRMKNFESLFALASLKIQGTKCLIDKE